MKKTQEILGLPIISISDGMEVGKVKSIIINADKGAIDYIVVDSGIQILSAKIIPTDNILGVGEYALTIENDGSINDISKIPAAIDLLQKNIQVKGTKVLTKKGRLIGEIGDIYVDENECCKITGLEYIADITQKRIRIIPRESVVTFGKNLVVVTDDVENALLDRATQLSPAGESVEAEKKNPVNLIAVEEAKISDSQQENSTSFGNVLVKTDNLIATDGEALYKEIEMPVDAETAEDVVENEVGTLSSLQVEDESDEDSGIFDEIADTIIEEVTDEVTYQIKEVRDEGFYPAVEDIAQTVETKTEAAAAPVPQQDNSAASLFEQKQRQYLKGRRATKTISDNSGNTIVTEGMIISDELIDIAKINGKLIELVMNNKA